MYGKEIPISINKVFQDAGLGCKIVYVGQDYDIIKDEPWIRLIQEGPDVTVTPSNIIHTLSIKVVVAVPDSSSNYFIYDLARQVAEILMEDLPIIDEEQNVIGCFDFDGEVLTRHFDKVDPDLPLKQSIIDAGYKIAVRR